ncbi:MAG: hypothetical protein ACRCWG_10320 [Sarcina sp.]
MELTLIFTLINIIILIAIIIFTVKFGRLAYKALKKYINEK